MARPTCQAPLPARPSRVARQGHGAMQGQGAKQGKSQGASCAPGPDRRWVAAQTVFFSVGEALKRTVLPAFTLIDSPVRGLSPLRALVLRTVKVPKLGKVNFPSFFISLTIASIRSLVARLAAAPVTSVDC